MSTRRAFLKTAAGAVAGGVIGWEGIARAAEGKSARRSRCEASSACATATAAQPNRTWRSPATARLKGYAGPLLKEQVAAFPANLRELLVGRDAADPEKLNFSHALGRLPPGKALESYAEGQRPADRRDGVGHRPHDTPDRDRLGHHGAERSRPGAVGPAWQGGADSPSGACSGAKRERLNAYASMLGYSVKPDRGAEGGPRVFSTRVSSDRSGSS